MKKIFVVLCSVLICMSFALGLTACGTDGNSNSGEQIIDLSTDTCTLSDYLSVDVIVDCKPVEMNIYNGYYNYESTGIITVNITSYTNLDIKYDSVFINVDLRINNPRLWKWEYTSGGEDFTSYIKKDKYVSLSANGSAQFTENIKLFYSESLGSLWGGDRDIEAPSVTAWLVGNKSGKIIIR